jgi:hypothetical protein
MLQTKRVGGIDAAVFFIHKNTRTTQQCETLDIVSPQSQNPH